MTTEGKPSEKLFLRRMLANLKAFGLGCLIVVVVLGAAEGGLRLRERLLRPPDNTPLASNLPQYREPDPVLCFKMRPNIIVHNRTSRGERLIYENTYTLDGESRRVTPCAARPERVAAFFGCSYTFGLGANDDETLPARFCAHRPEYLGLNYGCAGYGPQQMWLQINKLGVLGNLPIKKGAVVYLFIPDHLNRLVGTSAVLAGWGKDSLPWLAMDGDRIAWKGTFYDRSPLQSLFVRHVQGLSLVRLMAAASPFPPDDRGTRQDAMLLLAKVLQECARTTHSASPELEFYCVLYPKACDPGLADTLRRGGVRVFDYRGLLGDYAAQVKEGLYYEDAREGGFCHPKPLVYEMIADKLAADLDR